MRSSFPGCFFLLWASLAAAAEAGEISSLDYFETHIRPLFIEHCYECHSTESGKSKGGLLLDSREGWANGGDHGPAIHPGQPDKSLLLRAVSYRDAELQMPPEKRLSDQERTALETWVRKGAQDPREPVSALSKTSPSFAKSKDHWSFQPVQSPQPPAIKASTWSIGPTDAFLEAQHQLAKITPAADTDTFTQLRRLYLTITGLPPTASQIDAFLADDASPNPWERLTDRLLASPQYGEHWGRHWLDVTRFAESSGGGRSLMFKEAWRFRDYVIDAINADIPVDDFIREHLAGDLLFQQEPLDAPRQRERIVATGFLALGPTNYELQDKELLRMEVVDEQIDTMGRAFLGMTLGCARCHDHKFDPVSTEEYYALAGIFRSTKTITPGNVSGFVQTPLPDPRNPERIAFEKELQKREAELKAAQRDPKEIKNVLAKLEEQGPPPIPLLMSVKDETPEEIADCHVRIRGAIRSLGNLVPRGFLRAATPAGMASRLDLNKNASGRLELTQWLTHPDHPLTSRVYVNRVWHHVFGQGLVRTVDNFGHTGERPSHPDLLDYLAGDFVSEGRWSTKRLVRMLVLSRAFQLGHQGRGIDHDPENRLLWRAHDRALSAESLRDSILLVSGELDLSSGGPTIEKFSDYDNGYQFGDFYRRTLYAPAFRNARLEILNLFDAANPNMPQGKRDRTTLSTQALFLMNSPFVMDRSIVVAKRLAAAHPHAEARLNAAYTQILNRAPLPEERHLAESYLAEVPADKAWPTLIQSLFASVDFRSLH